MTVLVVASALAAAAPASAQEVTVQPGAAIRSGGIACTMAWIFDGRPGTPQQGAVFGATAAHCVPGVGAQVDVRPVEATGAGGGRIGHVVLRGDDAVEGRDYAFFRIDDDDLPRVSPAMKGSPSFPSGLPRNPVPGDTMAFSGYGAGFELHAALREGRTGLLNRAGDAEHDVTGPILSGDSGGPVADVTDGGTAYGIVNTIGAGVNSTAQTVVVAGEGGANLRWVLADAASRGFHVRLRTASGAPADDDELTR